MLTLWQDASPTIQYTTTGGAQGRTPEPLFFRGNTGDIIEFWHTNLVPNYYNVDDFQVRTPTDILGQHIHLVKFDVTSSDGAGNGFNYEDGTFSPGEVQEIIRAINHSPTNGFMNFPNQPLLDPASAHTKRSMRRRKRSGTAQRIRLRFVASLVRNGLRPPAVRFA